MERSNQERIQQLRREIAYETKARDLGVNLGLGIMLTLSIVSLGITIAGIILHPLNVGTIWDITICFINLTTSIYCVFRLLGKDKDIAIFVDRLLKLIKLERN